MTYAGTADGQITAPRRWIKTIVGVQLYVLASYVATAIVPYLWAPRAYPPLWLWFIPGWLLGVPGYYITTAGADLAVPLAVVGVVAAVAAWYLVSRRLFVWSVAVAAMATAYAAFTFTGLGRHLIWFVAD
jgi:hypothetical protein